MRILFCGQTFPAAPQTLEGLLGHEFGIAVCDQNQIAKSVEGVDVLIPLMSRIDANIMRAGKVRLIQQWGAGVEGVDLHTARQLGIPVANVPATGSNAESVAELVIMSTIALMRDLPAATESVRAGRLGSPIGRMLKGRTVCLWGLGAIASALAPRLKAFGVRLIGISRDTQSPKVQELGLDACYPPEHRGSCLAETDALILCVKLSNETRGIVDAAALQALKPGAVLINAARGALVDYAALTSALESGRLAGAALDVFWTEPISPSDPLLSLPNVIATPHIGGVTDRSYAEIAEAVATNIKRLSRNEPLLNLVI